MYGLMTDGFKKRIKINATDIVFFILYILLSGQNLTPTLPTMQLEFPFGNWLF